MRTHAIDTETKLIRRGHVAPELVCLTEASLEGSDIWHRSDPKLLGRVLEILKGRTVGHNLAYDLAVLCSWNPDLFPAVFDAAFGLRLEDTGINDKLHHISTTGQTEGTRFSLNDVGGRWGQADRSAEKQGEDIWRLRYGELIDTPLPKWPAEATSYAIDDAVETFNIWQNQMNECSADGPGSMNTRAFQTAVDFSLYLYFCRGMVTDQERVEQLAAKLEDFISPANNKEMINAGIMTPPEPARPYKNGAQAHVEGCDKDCCSCPAKMKSAEPARTKQKALATRIKAACATHSIPLQYTEKGNVSSTREFLYQFEELDPVLTQYSEYKRHEKLHSTYISHMRGGIVYARYDILKETGRTSSYTDKIVDSIQIQNQPRLSGDMSIRECLVPRPGYWFLFCDISSMELCTFAQRCLDLGFSSRMAEIINKGIDAHAYLGAQIASLLDETFGQLCMDKHAVTTDEIHDLFMDWKDYNPKRWKHFRTFAKPTNLGYPGGLGPDTFITYAWGTFRVRVTRDLAVRLRDLWFKTFPEATRYFDWVNRQGDPEHFGSFCYTTPKGMYRANTTFCSTANGFGLQSPGAEGAKTGAAMVARECYDITQKSALISSFPVAFIHDEVGLEVPARYEVARPAAKRTEELMVMGMKSVLPDIDVKAQSSLMDRWYKEAEPVYNKQGELELWQPLHN